MPLNDYLKFKRIGILNSDIFNFLSICSGDVVVIIWELLWLHFLHKFSDNFRFCDAFFWHEEA
ncbi:hypothetical protein F164LOC_09705 [Pectobacterium carotovorum]|nr:hypothetical protein F164LOC_09705 [Pectobacterium carotovorum]